MDPSILIKLAVLAIAFAGVLRLGVLAWEKLQNKYGTRASNFALSVVTLS